MKWKFANNKNVLELVKEHSQIFSDFLITFFEISIWWLFEKSKIVSENSEKIWEYSMTNSKIFFF